MQLPDESIDYQFHRVLTAPAENWTPLAELQAQHLLSAERLDMLKRPLEAIRGQVAAERELQNPPAKLQPLQPGFIDLPERLYTSYRKKGDASELGRILRLATRLHKSTDRVIVLGTGASVLGARALFAALAHSHHNELPRKMRVGKPRLYFEGDSLDNDTLQDLMEYLETTCVEPESVDERWGVIVTNDASESLETAAAYRAIRAKAAAYYGPKSEELRQLIVPITGPKSRLRDQCRAEGIAEDDICTIPDNVSSRYSIFTAVGLLPAAVLGLDVTALLLGAAAMTKRFLEEPFGRNPVLQYAAVNYLFTEEQKKYTRVLATWTSKLEAVGRWYEQLLSESLGKNGRGPTPLTAVYTRDLHSRGQQHQDGTRDKFINNLYVRSPKHPPVMVGMAERNEDDLNAFSRKGYPDLVEAAFQGTNQAYHESARPAADILLPVLSEHTMGQLLQMLMLATVVEGRLANINPYGQPGKEAYKRNMLAALRATPNLPKGEVRDAAKGV